MKRLFSCLLAVLLVFSLTAAAFADNFFNDDANAGEPELVAAVDANKADVLEQITLTTYDKRASLDDARKANIEKAYASLAGAEDLKGINEELAQAAAGKLIVVCDLFDLAAADDAAIPADVTVKDSKLDKYVGLVYFEDGAWIWVPAEADESELSFAAEKQGVYALIDYVEAAGSGKPAESTKKPGAIFVNSVANAGAPELVSAKDVNGTDVTSWIKITPYNERNTLSGGSRKNIEKAFKDLRQTKDLAGICKELESAAGDKMIAVSDLFDVSASEDVSFSVSLVLKDSKLDNFVGLVFYQDDGSWKWVDATVEGKNLNFTAESQGAYAVIISVDEATSAQTGETVPYGFILGAVVLAGAAVWFFAKSRKVKA